VPEKRYFWESSFDLDAFEHENLIFFEDYLGVDAPVTRSADRDCRVVVKIRANAGWHVCPQIIAYL
jgi:hypothetical protein